MREVGLRTVARAKSLWQEGGVVPGRLCGQRVGVQCRRGRMGIATSPGVPCRLCRGKAWGAMEDFRQVGGVS